MAKIDRMEKFLKEEKPKKEKDLEIGFDIKSYDDVEDTDTTGFRSEFEPVSKGEEKKLKKEIQITTPGLKKSIKKFEDFQISVSIDELDDENSSECCDMCECEPCECDIDCCSDCNCNPCECNNCCQKCQCDPCECSSNNVVGFEDFLKKMI